jgi:hypothetical protein
VLPDLRIDQLPEMRFEALVRPFLVRAHQARMARHIGGEDPTGTSLIAGVQGCSAAPNTAVHLNGTVADETSATGSSRSDSGVQAPHASQAKGGLTEGALWASRPDRGIRFAHDSLVEGDGFEPSVPRVVCMAI